MTTEGVKEKEEGGFDGAPRGCVVEGAPAFS